MKQQNHKTNTVKIIGFVGAVAAALMLGASGQYIEALGVVAAALSSPLRGEFTGTE